MNYDFSSLTGVQDYEEVRQSRWAQIEAKYRRAGVYCIKLDNKIVYVGKSIHMLTRLFEHRREITENNPSEKKYQILAAAHLDGLSIDFDVLYHSRYKQDKRIKEDIAEREAYYINYLLPPLNKQIPTHKDFEKQQSLLPLVDNYQMAIDLAKSYNTEN